jgi:hypothetical protein
MSCSNAGDKRSFGSGVLIAGVAESSLAQELELAAAIESCGSTARRGAIISIFGFKRGETELVLQVKNQTAKVNWKSNARNRKISVSSLNKSCRANVPNECLFCFCKGNPADARPSLFVRDEDIRLSFLYGNYTTLSSITDDEMNRIVEQRLSPQYVSVHATDLKTRALLLGVDESRADISGKLQKLLDNDIEIHAQIVLCPTINDGAQLEKTLRDLAAHHPKIISAAIVPVALTRYNTDERLTRVTPEFLPSNNQRSRKNYKRNFVKISAYLRFSR